MKQNFSQIQLLEILQAEIRKKPLFSMASHAARNWATALGVIPRDPKYAQKPWNGSELPSGSEIGRTFWGKPSYYIFASK